MREIKFRGWFQGIEGTEMWVYGYLVKQTNGNWEITDGDTSYTVDNVGQFTGLYDKNGKEIYEGDKFKFKFMKELHNPIELIGSFDWHNDELRYEIDIHDHEDYVCLSFIGNGVMYDFEIIGNIHE